jgi:ubiquinone biosynthesis protein
MTAPNRSRELPTPPTRRARLTEIARVMSRNGLPALAEQLGLTAQRSWIPRRKDADTLLDPVTNAVRLRQTIEELGTTAIKLGQVLSTRPDLLSPEYLTELSKLRNRVPPVPVDHIRDEIESEFGQSIDELFAWFDNEPLAAASIGQAHVARLHSGEEVVVKIQKPGIAAQIDTDLRLLADFAGTAATHSKLAREYDFPAIVQEFAFALRGELDYQQEGRNADAFRAQFADTPDVVVPTIYWSHSSSRVLTMQRMHGVQIDDLAALEKMGVDRVDLAQRGAWMLMREMLEHGFYHADPHPGNLLVLESGAIGMLDFGMVGRISDTLKLDLVDLVAAILSNNANQVVNALESLGIAGIGQHRDALVRDLDRLMQQFLGRSLGEIRIDDMTEALFATIRQNQLRMPSDLVMLLKTLTMYEGVGRVLDPDFNVIPVASPFVQQELQRRMNPFEWKDDIKQGLLDSARMSMDMPGQLRRMARRIDRGEFTMVVRHQEIDHSLHRLERIANRIALAILIGASLIGLGLLLATFGPDFERIWIGRAFWVGVIVTVLAAIALAINIIRSERD